MECDELREYKRKVVAFKDFGRFKLLERRYDDNSFNIYTARLNDLREDTLRKAKLKWMDHPYVEISRLAVEDREKSYILIGVLYKDDLKEKLKLSLLRDIDNEPQQEALLNDGYMSNCIKIFLEDETSCVRLVGNHMDAQEIITGVVCAVFGYETETGAFWVEDWCFPGYCPKPCTLMGSSLEGGKILLVSGLDLVNNTDDLSLDLLSEWITGMAGCANAQEEEAVVAKVIIAGNSIRSSTRLHNYKGYYETKFQDQRKIKEDLMAMRKLDSFLVKILHCCYVVLMPGQFDPTSYYSMPQQPFHPCTLQKSARFKSMHGVTNPWIGDIGGRVVAGSCGRPIEDIMTVTKSDEPLRWMERTLTWRHYAPTGPNTLPAHPFFKSDPFVMTECPDIYFAGNMDTHDSKLAEGDEGQTVRLICVPKFSETKTAVLVDLQDLTTQPISFGSG
ncbi:PREDICTED: DNA polymerase delta subunit 2-like [Dinoponera quadriceps]|uniref:DNA polymerase delta subunit 2-like n=1 Tax=Dinoponera quadriceps TaxID=609295 RepID=A0A6P3XQ79_DINQU|nr:PREDICTED: DNA polymerase delta subunit 2-like [Dinoponera quadriceps]